MVTKMSASGARGGVADYCLTTGGCGAGASGEQSGWNGETRNLARAGGSCGADHGPQRVPGLKRLAGTGRKLEKRQLAELGGRRSRTGKTMLPLGEPEGAGDGEAPGADRFGTQPHVM